MKADLTRRTFRHEHHYIATLQQQGRVPIDADWNEQGEIQQHHDECEATDIIGQAGFPQGDSFRVDVTPDNKDLRVYPGRAYVDGIMAELDADPVGVTINTLATLTPLTWTLDGVDLRLGEWVQVSSNPGDGKTYRITAMDPTTLLLTLGVGSDNLVTLFGGAGKQPQIARVVTYGVQPEWWHPDGTTWPAPPALPTVALPPALPGPPPVPGGPGLYLAYLDVWRRHVTALEDPEIREVALGGPDTCTRVRTTWQVRLSFAGALSSSVTCATAVLPAAIATGSLAARAAQPSTDTPCVIAPTARYRSLENQLYRVEVHKGGALGAATFKYSADNGTVVSAWTSVDPSGNLVVSSIGKDSVLRFSSGQWVELIDDSRELAGVPGDMFQINVVGSNWISLVGAPAIDFTQYPLNPRIRRWDQTSASGTLLVQVGPGDGFIALDTSGVEVLFQPGTYTTGDYWLIPARTITTDVDWPKSELGTPLAQPPLGIQHHYAKLAMVSWSGSAFTWLTDCRAQFPPITDIHAKNIIMDDGPCDFPPGTNVQQAISLLCSQKANACCELVIVPGDDVQSAINTALAKNVALGINGMHVCFAAGTHTLPTTVTVTAPKGGGDITISGCGLASHVVASSVGTAFLITGWTTAAVTDLTISAGIPAPPPKPVKGQLKMMPVTPAVKVPSGVIVMLDCTASVVERAAITCGASPKRVTSCIAIKTSAVPNKSEARVTDCDLTVGNKQIGIGLTSIARSTVEGNRLDVAPLSTAERAAYTISPEYLGYLRTRLMSDLRIGTAAGKTVDTIDGTLRNHITINNVKLAFTSDSTATPIWSAFSAAGKLSKLASLDRTETLTKALARDKAAKVAKKTKKAAAKAPAKPPAAPKTTVAAPPAPPDGVEAQALIADGSVPNNLAARVRTKLKHEVTKILRAVSNPKMTTSEISSAGLEQFAGWKTTQDQAVAPAIGEAIVVAGGYASDVRVLDNSITSTMTGIRVAVKYQATGGLEIISGDTAPTVSVTRARVAGNTIGFTLPVGTRGTYSGVYVGNCASLAIEDNYSRRAAKGATCIGVRVLGLLGKMMRAEGNHAIHTTTGIAVHLIKTDPNSDPSKGALWILSQNVAESTTTPIDAPNAAIVKINNAP